MLYDLNIAWSPGTSSSEIESTLRFAKHLGYDVVALNHTISGPSIPTNPNPITNPIPPQLSSAPGTSTAPSPQRPPSSLPTVLRRATLLVTDPSTTNYRLADHSRSYDLLALRPTSEKSFAWACSSATEPPALISLDMTASLGFHIHHRTAMAAVARGSRFEICYSQALVAAGGAEASRHRANFIGNVQGLVRATKGRGLVLSSEAQSALGLRGPADVVNLMAVWGLGPERGMEALGTTPRSVVVNEGVRRRGFRGVVDIVKPAEGGDEVLRREKEENGNGKKDKQKQQQGQKRKNGAGGGGGGGGVGGQNSGGPGGEGGMSKRQAKKLRKEGPAGV